MTEHKDQASTGTAGSLGVPVRKHPSSGAIAALAAPSWIERRALHKLLALMGNPPVRFVLWNGEQVPATGSPECRRLLIHDRQTLWQLVINPDLHFGDAYSRGALDIEGDLTGFIELINRSRRNTSRQSPLLGAFLSRRNHARANTLAGSRSNIHHHYNLGNDFFQLWLDEEMVYTCAYFPTMTLTLEQAQLAKLDYVCRKLRLQPGETVIEAGCGWGSLARYMAREYGVKVRAFNISAEQVRYARERAAAEGLGRNVEYIEDDYRNISGQCDVFVSVGMLEHVGRDNYRNLGGIIDRCLAPAGRGLIHSIGRDQPCPMNAWIERRVFPGSYPPTLREMMDIFEPWGFSVLDVENLRPHYAKTLEHWLARFEAHRDEVRERFDENFVRAWRLYLAGSMASFTTGWLQLFQVVFTRPDSNKIPWTRDHLYAHRT
ncbi:MAG: cyclopropane-fatty-acyl-phospholipid synthase family protein [Gammaproteobacteria bacterium]